MFFFLFLSTSVFAKHNNKIITESDTLYWQKQLEKLNGDLVELYDKGEFRPAKKIAQQAVSLAKEHLGKHNINYLNALYNLTIFLEQEGNNELAIETYLKIKAIEEKLKIGNDDLSISYNTIGWSYAMLGDYSNALNYFNQAVKLRLDAPSTKDTILITFLSDKALCLQHLDQLKAATQTNQRCLNLIHQFDYSRMPYIQQVALYSYQNLAAISMMEEQVPEKTLAYLQQAETIVKKYQPAQKCYYTYELLGNFAVSQKMYQSAQLHYDKALQLLKKESTGIKKDARLGQLYTQKAIVYRKENQLKPALLYHEKALESITANVTNPDISPFINKLSAIHFLAEKAKTLTSANDLLAAHQTYLLATPLIPETRRSFKEEGSKYLLASTTTSIYENAIEVALQLYQTTNQESYLEQALNLSESTKAVRLLEDLQHKIFKDSTHILPPQLLAKEQQLRYKINSLERQIYSVKYTESSKNNISILEDSLLFYKEIYYTELEKELKEYPKYWSFRYDVAPLDLKQIRSNILNEQTALIEFFVGERSLYLFFISKEDFFVQTITKTQPLEEAIKTLQQITSISPKQITTSLETQYQQFAKTSNFLYQTLLERSLVSKNSSIEQLIIIPDGMLFNLPWDVLLMNSAKGRNYTIDNNEYLFKNYALSYHYSINLFRNFTSNMKEEVFAGFAPSFEKYAPLNPLFYAKNEVQASSAIFGGQVFFNTTANYATFNEQIKKVKILHLSTHAEKDMQYAMLNKIYLTDTILTHYDLENFDFNTDLVVLSACHTGSGKLIKGEGAMTLARSMLRSGCRSTLATSWSVDDNTSKNIMLNFYKKIANGYSKNKALQFAKKTYLKANANNNLKAHPFYWASFQQYGSSIPIFNKSKFLKYSLIIVSLIIGVLVGLKYLISGSKKTSQVTSFSID